MELKGRLKLIADKVPVCQILCDIGTDHAYIPIYLVKNDICKKAIAADVKKGPLKAAEENIRLNGVESRIETRLGDGLAPIDEGEADVIVIAGMGGILIKDIMSRQQGKARKAKTLVLQPMNAIEITREWLYNNGFEILDEELIDEGDKIYNVIVATWTGEVRKVEEIFYYLGSKLIENRDPLLVKYLVRKHAQAVAILEELKNTREDHSEIQKVYEYLRENYAAILKDAEGEYER